MMQYDLDNGFPEHFLAGTPRVDNPFGKRLVEQGIKQFRLTETQKFPMSLFSTTADTVNHLTQK